LVKQRLLTSLGGSDNRSYELIHDLLADVVEKSRLTREAVHTEYYRSFAKRNGFPVGIIKISESEARRLPVSFRLTYKYWKPAFRVEAVNRLLELTTKHSVFPYLWQGEFEPAGARETKPGEKGERLGLRRVCQWEFVSTTKDEIIYERALDRVGQMVYGLIYSPLGSGSLSTRLTRFVGPDGFPQLQRRSDAEYVQIHYDEAGWEDCIMYRDGKNRPAAGPAGAFGRSMQHDESTGQITCATYLGLDGEPTSIADGYAT